MNKTMRPHLPRSHSAASLEQPWGAVDVRVGWSPHVQLLTDSLAGCRVTFHGPCFIGCFPLCPVAKGIEYFVQQVMCHLLEGKRSLDNLVLTTGPCRLLVAIDPVFDPT